jgi:hypothetical protein
MILFQRFKNGFVNIDVSPFLFEMGGISLIYELEYVEFGDKFNNNKSNSPE